MGGGGMTLSRVADAPGQLRLSFLTPTVLFMSTGQPTREGAKILEKLLGKLELASDRIHLMLMMRYMAEVRFQIQIVGPR